MSVRAPTTTKARRICSSSEFMDERNENILKKLREMLTNSNCSYSKYFICVQGTNLKAAMYFVLTVEAGQSKNKGR